MKPTRLQVPPMESGNGRFSGRTTRHIAQWMEELPRADGRALGELLLQALDDINGHRLQRAERFQVQEMLRPLCYDCCATLIRDYRDSGLPLTGDRQHAADLVRRLLGALAAGFKRAVNEQLEWVEPSRKNGATLTLQLSIQRAILALGRGLVESYRVYHPEPGHLWRDLHTLYRNAEIFGLQGLPIEGTRDADETALSIKQAYLRVAVLALSNPYHLSHGEAEELYRRIGRWVHFVAVREPEAGSDLAGHFVVDLTSDLPARYMPRTLWQPLPEEPRVLDLDRLVAALDQQILQARSSLEKKHRSEALSARMQRDMYIRFRAALGGRGERTDERRPTVARVRLTTGLSGCHFLLSGGRRFKPQTSEQQWREAVDSVSDGAERKKPELRLQEDDELDVGRQTAESRVARFRGYDADADDIWRKANIVDRKNDKVASGQRPVVTWNRKNESSGGMALFCGEDCDLQMQVGELLTYRSKDAAPSESWNVGTIRWLRTRERGGVEIGVKQLAPDAHAAAIQTVQGAGQGVEYLRALLLPRVNPLVRPATLITPASVYDVDSLLKLNLDELVLYIRLTELIETTRQFAHFRFRIVEPPRHELRRPT